MKAYITDSIILIMPNTPVTFLNGYSGALLLKIRRTIATHELYHAIIHYNINLYTETLTRRIYYETHTYNNIHCSYCHNYDI